MVILTLEEVAKQLNISLMTVYRWTKSGKLPHVKLGKRCYRVTLDQLTQFLKDNSTK